MTLDARSSHASTDRSPLSDVVRQSAELTDLVASAWQDTPLQNEARTQAAEGLCALSIEHAFSVQMLIETCPASAIALVRPQYESLVRAVWSYHAATAPELDRLLAPLSLASQQAAKKLPGVPEMLERIEGAGPRGAAALLSRARTRMNDGLNSYIHGGIHPFARARAGYPLNFLIDMQKNSNAMSFLTMLVLAEVSEDADIVAVLPALHHRFENVLPDLEPFESL
jgi:hypothetical protein